MLFNFLLYDHVLNLPSVIYFPLIASPQPLISFTHVNISFDLSRFFYFIASREHVSELSSFGNLTSCMGV
jgi:hypothetical protein